MRLAIFLPVAGRMIFGNGTVPNRTSFAVGLGLPYMQPADTVHSYFQFLAYLAGALLAIHVLLPFVSGSPAYISFLGYVGLAVEAILPLPQIFKNHRARSCKGFRLSVIINWLAGDAMKMSYFFLSSEFVPWPFRLCGIFQACCDCYLGLQYYMYGQGPAGLDVPMSTTAKSSMMG